MPPQSAPAMNAKRDAADRAAESPCTPAKAKARNTTFPVMFAVKTCPSAIKLRASIRPVLNVSVVSAVITRLVPLAATDCAGLELVTIRPPPESFKQYLGHHAFVFMVEKVAVKYRHASYYGIGEVYDHVDRAPVRNARRINPLRVRKLCSVHGVHQKMYLMEVHGM